MKLAVKYMLKGKKRDGGKEMLEYDFSNVLDNVVKGQIQEAEAQYNINKMAKLLNYLVWLTSLIAH